MAGILTPVSIWSDFHINDNVCADIIEEVKKGGVIITKMYINGRDTGDGQVKIYAEAARSVELSLLPCVMIFPDFTADIDQDLLIKFAKAGYYAVSVDLSGKKEGKEFFTEYPYCVNYANYSFAKDRLLQIDGDIRKSHWYEWDCVGKYALYYVSGLPFVTGIGGLGISTAATVLWHVAANEPKLSAAAFAFSAGWDAYFNRGLYKFKGEIADFSENELKYLAGVDAEAYASFIKCHSLILTSTNNPEFDFDRAFDTLTRISKDVYSGIDYSVNRAKTLDEHAVENLFLFFDRILQKRQASLSDLPSTPDIDCGIENGEMVIEAEAGIDGLKKISLYAAEQTIMPTLRSWAKVGEIEADELCDGKFSFKYSPYCNSGAAMFFVKAEYDNGFTVSSNVICKKFAANEIKNKLKSNIVYSDRLFCGERVFAPIEDNDAHFLSYENKRICVKKGPMDIYGVTCEGGLLTYKINAEKDKPADGAIFLIDAYCKEAAPLKVSVLTLSDGIVKEYFTQINVAGGKVWHNFKIEQNKFKSIEGMQLKTFKNATAIKISCEKEYLINNLLWI